MIMQIRTNPSATPRPIAVEFDEDDDDGDSDEFSPGSANWIIWEKLPGPALFSART